MTSPAAGSAHHQPAAALRTNPSSTAREQPVDHSHSTTVPAPISISESNPNPASATECARPAAIANTTMPTTFHANVAASRRKPGASQPRRGCHGRRDRHLRLVPDRLPSRARPVRHAARQRCAPPYRRRLQPATHARPARASTSTSQRAANRLTTAALHRRTAADPQHPSTSSHARAKAHPS